MRFAAVVGLLVCATVPVTVSACEGDCIVGITNAFLTNYTRPVDFVMDNVAKQISNMLPTHPGLETSRNYLRLFMDAYQNDAYDGMETAIFPSYFHGKCQQDGVDPPGCPNPDCPVVCGTPGSLVHFYPQLRYIAFNQTKHHLQMLATPGSDAYRQVEQNVLDADDAKTRRAIRIYRRSSYGTVPLYLTRREEDMKTRLKEIMQNVGPMLLQTCGGLADGETNGLSDCSWEQAMKEYILTFP
ncbi:uncharacterized protein PHACADRAFT_174328 [Phanerochaete carnosa HHB-10118-sp]|uniref:Uncharacterized protein n=1 Tax=Phanerochaete carnosa (strain HHB-10118-sp) TaxID=650164 RepID=K5V100_PHACS|nr:uncharacterized protein PHACADRAFT_174328 [Phanerochaete carnosa HHB-10118-sp]EKM56161.1 hypothetical protein PHACADRAFT_174328 [Phanerochaete carnosa HHB-10118-sp]